MDCLIARGSRRLAARGFRFVSSVIGLLKHGVESYDALMYIVRSEACCSKPHFTLGGSRDSINVDN
jgi:hypothetical protein